MQNFTNIFQKVDGDPRVRTDLYGNVIALDRPAYSIFSIQWDHLFPWSKGGRQAEGNLIALQYYANSRKSNSWFWAMKERKMMAGCTTDMFRYMLIEAKELTLKNPNKPEEPLDPVDWILAKDWYVLWKLIVPKFC